MAKITAKALAAIIPGKWRRDSDSDWTVQAGGWDVWVYHRPLPPAWVVVADRVLDVNRARRAVYNQIRVERWDALDALRAVKRHLDVKGD